MLPECDLPPQSRHMLHKEYAVTTIWRRKKGERGAA
jgi:hypothetical protein